MNKQEKGSENRAQIIVEYKGGALCPALRMKHGQFTRLSSLCQNITNYHSQEPTGQQKIKKGENLCFQGLMNVLLNRI